MNAGKNYRSAKRQAQANADYTDSPRWLHRYGDVWWISKTPVADSELIEPGGSTQTTSPRMSDRRSALAMRAREIERAARLGRRARWGPAPDLDGLLVAADAWEEAGLTKHADRLRKIVAVRLPLEDRVSGPGKFEGEGPWVPYFWEQSLEGMADEETRRGDSIFRVRGQDLHLFPELAGVRRVVVTEDSVGFVYVDLR